ncbi:hypothetical protein V6N13_112055 [Hibiscus sabdariffa]|uniref:Uncharacterized protein n=1 Tax=Hibiscus sabdariffa TaxID=183260 RepID=A0ABR2TN02_9ROSI
MVEDDQPPIASTQMLYNRLGTSSEPIWLGSNESKLSMVSELIHLKAQYRIPNTCYDDLFQIMQRLMSEDNVMSKNIYETKNLVHDMGFSGMQPPMHPTTAMPLRPQVTYPPRDSIPSAPFVQSPINEEEAYYSNPPPPQQAKMNFYLIFFSLNLWILSLDMK